MTIIQRILRSVKKNNTGNKNKKEVSFQRLGKTGKISVFTSGKGGTGKSSLASAIAGFLSLAGQKVLLIDTDTGLQNLGFMLGVDSEIFYDLYDVLERGIPWEKSVVAIPGFKSFYLLPSDQIRDKQSIRKDAFEFFLLKAVRYFDHIIIDSPSGMEYGFNFAVSSVDMAFVVIVPETPSIMDGAQILRRLEDRHITSHIIVNKRVEKFENVNLSPTSDEIERILGKPVLTSIPMDTIIMACNHKGIPIALWNKEGEAPNAIRSFVQKFWTAKNNVQNVKE
jgi:septum site-determining protein MinD